MNALWRKKSVDLRSVSTRSGWPRALLLVGLFGTVASLVTSSNGSVLGPVMPAAFGCAQSGSPNTPEPGAGELGAGELNTGELKPGELSAGPVAAQPRSTAMDGSTHQMRLLLGILLAAERRRVCVWKGLSQHSSGAPLAALAWLIALTGGSVGLARPVGVLLPFLRRTCLTPTRAPPLRDATNRFERCFAGAVDGMMLVRVMPDGGFVCSDTNAAWQQLLGESNALSAGCQPQRNGSGPIPDALVARLKDCVADGRSVRFQQRATEPNQRDIFIIITPVRDVVAPGGTVKPIETLLCQAYDDTLHARLTAHLQQEQRMETIRRLAAGVAHDFNNLLQAVCGGLELIIDESGSVASTRELATIALAAAQRGSHLTQHLLSYARRQALTPQPIDLREFLPRMRAAIEHAIGPDNELEIAFFDDHSTIFADQTNLRTALLNLAVNAGRAMPGGGRLRIETSLDTVDHGACVRILVSDTGVGMDAATLARCDEPFFTTKGATGTGLGLSMVQGFAVQSGGTLHLSSIPGQGTSAVLTLPACPLKATPDVCQNQGDFIGHILLVDDTADVLVTTGCMLQRAGFEVTPVQSGDAALARIAAGQRVDVLVTDYAMPGLSGVELIRLAREMRPGLPGLIITGFHEVDIALLRETAQVLRKPFQRDDLLNAVQAQIQAAEHLQPLRTHERLQAGRG